MLGLEHVTARGAIQMEYYGRNVGVKIMPTGVKPERFLGAFKWQDTIWRRGELKSQVNPATHMHFPPLHSRGIWHAAHDPVTKYDLADRLHCWSGVLGRIGALSLQPLMAMMVPIPHSFTMLPVPHSRML